MEGVKNYGISQPSSTVESPQLTAENHSVSLEDGPNLSVSVVEGDDNVLLQTIAWSEYSCRPDAQARYELMAQKLGATLVTIDSPGVSGIDKVNLTAKQRRLLSRGDSHEISSMQWEALRHVDINLGKVGVLGYSLGAPLAASLASKAPKGTQVETIDLLEPVGNQPTAAPKLLWQFIESAPESNGHKKNDPEWYRALTTSNLPLSSWKELIAYGQFIAHGKHYDALRNDESTAKNAAITVVSNYNSQLVSPEAATELAEKLNAENQIIIRGQNIGHGAIDNLGYVATLSAILKDIR